jgi:stage II sporulation protein D
MRAALVTLCFSTVCYAQVTYKVRLTANEGNRVVELSAEQYVAAVLAGESGIFRSDEALKAMAVTARTFAAHQRGRHSAEGFDFCATTHCQRVDLGSVTMRVRASANSTAGELLWYRARPAFTVYSRNCGGKTERASAVWPDMDTPYLITHADTYCTRNNAYDWNWTVPLTSIVKALKASNLQAPATLTNVRVLSRTGSGRVSTLLLQGDTQLVPIAAGSLRLAIGRALGWNTIRSDLYEVSIQAGNIRFHGHGQGHGVGLCQEGADAMGMEGLSYRDILAYYYVGTKLGITGTGLDWTRVGGERVALFTTDPSRDAPVLVMAETAVGSLAKRWPSLNLPVLQIRVYPDVDTFRNASGEPGWVAAHTSGTWIDLQPVSKLREAGALDRTIRHEIIHAAIENSARANLPVWFREGLAEWLAEPAHTATPPYSLGNDGIRQRTNRDRARQAYADAKAQVASLIQRYGEETVLGWLQRGLPAEAANSRVSSPATNNK